MAGKLFQTILAGCTFLIAPPCSAQELDSLRRELRDAVHDTSFARTAYHLARTHFGLGAPDSVVMYAQRGLQRLANVRIPDQRVGFWRVQLWRIRGMGWYTASRFDSSIVAFQRMYHFAEQQHIVKDMGAALSYQGFALRQVEDRTGAMDMVLSAIRLLKELPPGPDLANCYHELAVLYSDLNQLDSAIHWHTEAGELYEAQGDTHHLVNNLVNLAEAYFKARRWQEADSAQHLAGTLLPRHGDPTQYVRWVVGEARSLLRRGDGKAAEHLLDSAITLAHGMDEFNVAYHLRSLRSLAFAQEGRMTDAFTDQLLALDAHVTDMDLGKVRATEKARAGVEHEKIVAVARAEAEKERTLKWAAIAVGALGVLLALILFRSYRAKSKANEAIRRAQTELVHSEKQREAELVRTRIARDIHDDIGATLTKIALLSGMAAQRNHDEAGSGRVFSRISEHAKNASRAISDVVWAVDPQRDTHQGMLDHVRDLSQRLLGDNGIQYALDLIAFRPEAQVEPALKRDLHLVLNECFNNILKYAHARSVRVKLELQADSFELRVDDDGIGFDPEQVHGRGNGLTNMPARMKQHNGFLSVTSAPGKGTALHAHGPLK
jgi:signal transduction histidine kinase